MGDIYGDIHGEEIYTERGHIQREDLRGGERIYAEKGLTLRGDIHKEGTYTGERHTRRGYMHGGVTYTKTYTEKGHTRKKDKHV